MQWLDGNWVVAIFSVIMAAGSFFSSVAVLGHRVRRLEESVGRRVAKDRYEDRQKELDEEIHRLIADVGNIEILLRDLTNNTVHLTGKVDALLEIHRRENT